MDRPVREVVIQRGFNPFPAEKIYDLRKIELLKLVCDKEDSTKFLRVDNDQREPLLCLRFYDGVKGDCVTISLTYEGVTEVVNLLSKALKEE